MENQARINKLLDRLNVQLAIRRRERRKPKLAQKKEQLQHASLICKLFRKSLKVKMASDFDSKEFVFNDFIVLENFVITPDDQFIDVKNIEEVSFV